ncbi:MAG: hypothetical protein ACOC2H_06765 [Spirochaetota bacterium]
MKYAPYACILILFFSVSRLDPVETDDGFLLEGERTDYSRYPNREYAPQIQMMRGTVVDDSRVFLFWERIPYRNVIYTVYRNTRPLDTYSAMRSATVIAKMQDKDQFLDSTIRQNGSYYYGITTGMENMKEDIQLDPGSSYIPKPFVIRDAARTTQLPDAEDESRTRSVRGLTAHERGGTLVLEWNNPDGFNGYVRILSSANPILNREAAREAAQIARIPAAQRHTVGQTPQNGIYFCILLEENGTVYYVFQSPGNCTFYAPGQRPAPPTGDFDRSSPGQREGGTDGERNYDNEIDTIVRNIYRTDNYVLLEKRLLAIARRTQSQRIRAKALFYTGRVRVEKGEYQSALKLFYRADVQRYYKEESRFWQDFCLSRLN